MTTYVHADDLPDDVLQEVIHRRLACLANATDHGRLTADDLVMIDEELTYVSSLKLELKRRENERDLHQARLAIRQG